jgi:hypothetical protein
LTLVLSCLTPDFVIQVSDRRLTYPNGSLADDETNKAVCFYGRIFFAYIGLSKVARMDTHVWLAEALNRAKTSGSTGGVINLLRTDATRAFQAIPGRTLKRHAFVAVGWATFPDQPDHLRPFISTISNAIDANGNWLAQANRQFDVGVRPLLDGEAFHFAAHGQSLTPSETVSIRRNIRRALARGGGPSSVARLLTTLLRSVARRNSAVGESMLVSVLPRNAVGNQEVVMPLPEGAQLPFPQLSNIRDRAVCLYIPEDSTSPVYYGPTVVTEDMLIYGVRVGTEPPPWIPP